MSFALVPQYVVEDWVAACRTEPRAIEMAYALALALPPNETEGLGAVHMQGEDGELPGIAEEVRAVLDDGYAKYEALRQGTFQPIDMGNVNLLAFERVTADERVLVVNNLARVSQPVKFREYAGREGWDILNRVEFIFPTRAQLEPYEFLWLLVE